MMMNEGRKELRLDPIAHNSGERGRHASLLMACKTPGNVLTLVLVF